MDRDKNLKNDDKLNREPFNDRKSGVGTEHEVTRRPEGEFEGSTGNVSGGRTGSTEGGQSTGRTSGSDIETGRTGSGIGSGSDLEQ